LSDARGSDGHAASFRVRFDEAGPDGLLRTSSLLRYAQDLAARHSDALGYDRAWYRERGFTWLVRAAAIDVFAPIHHGAELAGTTRVLGFRRVWSRRESTFHLGPELVARVGIDWVLLDERGAPTRIPADIETAFPGVAPAVTLQLGRVSLGDARDGAPSRSFEVRPHELDPLDHVNNAVYADWVEEAVLVDPAGRAAIGALPRRLRLEYALAAGPGDRVAATCWADEAGWSCRIVRSADGLDLVRARLEPGPPPATRDGARADRTDRTDRTGPNPR
jgi:acyl-ACP thioesterase